MQLHIRNYDRDRDLHQADQITIVDSNVETSETDHIGWDEFDAQYENPELSDDENNVEAMFLRGHADQILASDEYDDDDQYRVDLPDDLQLFENESSDFDDHALAEFDLQSDKSSMEQSAASDTEILLQNDLINTESDDSIFNSSSSSELPGLDPGPISHEHNCIPLKLSSFQIKYVEILKMMIGTGGSERSYQEDWLGKSTGY